MVTNSQKSDKLWKELEKKDNRILKLELELKDVNQLKVKDSKLKLSERESAERKKQRNYQYELCKKMAEEFNSMREWVERKWKGAKVGCTPGKEKGREDKKGKGKEKESGKERGHKRELKEVDSTNKEIKRRKSDSITISGKSSVFKQDV